MSPFGKLITFLGKPAHFQVLMSSLYDFHANLLDIKCALTMSLEHSNG